MARGRRTLRKRSHTIPGSTLDEAVLDLLRQSAPPLSAYDLVEGLGNAGQRVVPMSIYRSLERLSARGLVQKVEMLSAYRAKDPDRSVLMICLVCGSILPVEAPDLHDALAERLTQTGFVPRRVALEVAGLCAGCKAADPS